MLFEHHQKEFSQSAIDPNLAKINFQSFDYYNNPFGDCIESDGDNVSSLIQDYLGSVDGVNIEKRYQQNRSPRLGTAKAYNYLDAGGWCYIQDGTIRIKGDKPRYEIKSITVDDFHFKDKSICIDYDLAQAIIKAFPSIVDEPIEFSSTTKKLDESTKKALFDALKTIHKGFFSSFKIKLSITIRLKARKYDQPPKSKDILIMLSLPQHIIEKIFDNYDLDKSIINDDFDFWQFIIDNPQLPIIITEGEKKTACLLSQGYIAIGFTGIWKGFNSLKDEVTGKTIKRELRDYLLPFAVKGREFIFCFDNDNKVKTKLNVEKAIKTTGKLLNIKGCKASVILWDENFKGIDDLIYHYSKLNLSIIDDLFSNRKSLSFWENKINQSLDKFNPIRINEKFLTDRIEQGDRVEFINKNLGIKDDDQLICIKSYKGGGKTEYGANLTRLANNQGIPVLIIVHRVQLGKNSCERYGLPYIDEFKDSQFSIFGTGICIDSLHPDSQAKFKWENWAGAWLFLDEINQMLDHLLLGETCKKERLKIIDTFTKLLQFVIETGGKIFLFDADLSPYAIDYIKQKSCYTKAPKVIENTFKREVKRDLILFNESKPYKLIKESINQLREGKKLLIHVSGQKEKSTFGTIGLESYYQQLFPDLRILRIDAETVVEPSHGAYGIMNNLDYLENYDLVLASPVIETGVSIDIKNYFDNVFIIAWGVQSVDSVCQTLERLRDDVPRYIFTNKKGLIELRKGGGATTLKGLLASTHKTCSVIFNQLKALGIENNINFDDDDYCLNSELTTWAKIAVTHNLDYHDYRTRIIEKLEKEGYIVSEFSDNFDDDELKAQKLELKENTKKNYDGYKQKVCDSNDLEEKEYLRLKKARTRTKKQNLEIEKYNIKASLNQDVTPSLVENYDDGIVSQLRLEYYLTEGKEFLTHRDNSKINSLAYDGKIFKPDVNKSCLITKVKILERLEVLEFLKMEKICQDDLIDWYEKITNSPYYQSNLMMYLGITLAKRPIQALKQFLELIGYSLKQCETKKVKDEMGKYQKIRYYAPSSLYEIDRPAIFAYWNEKDLQRQSEQGLSPSDTPAPALNNEGVAQDLGTDICIKDISFNTNICPQNSQLNEGGASEHPAIGKEVILRGKKWTIHQIKDDMAHLINLIGDSLTYGLRALIMLNPEIIA